MQILAHVGVSGLPRFYGDAGNCHVDCFCDDDHQVAWMGEVEMLVPAMEPGLGAFLFGAYTSRSYSGGGLQFDGRSWA